jgi:hypothetical protein
MNVQNLTIGDSINKKLAFGPNFQTFDPAVVSFDIVWSGPITRLVSVPDGTLGNNYAGNYVESQVTVNWSGKNLATGFSFTANPGTLSTSTFDGGFAELGLERNGIFDAGALAIPASTGTMIAAPQGRLNSGSPSLGTLTGAAQLLSGPAGTAGSPNLTLNPMPFDSVLVVRALASLSTVTGATTLSSADTYTPSRIGEAQLVQSISAPHRPQVVDSVLAELESSALASDLHTEDAGVGVV